jgi:hypothetical protein
MKIIFYISLLAFGLLSCTLQTEPKVIISERLEGRTADNKYYADISLKNEGEQPAYFVILISLAYQKGKEIERKENAYGDIFNGVVKKNRVIFANIGFENPDSVIFKITYSLSMPGSPVH